MREKNKLIADFMGMKYAEKRARVDGEWIHSVYSLQTFQSSWDWLVPVANQILHCGEQKFMMGDNTKREIVNALISCKIHTLYEAVVNTIQEINKHA